MCHTLTRVAKRLTIALIALGGIGLTPSGGAHAQASPVTWRHCVAHLDAPTATRVVKIQCHRYPIRHPKGHVVGHRYWRVQRSSHVRDSYEYPIFRRPTPTLPACYWPAVRQYASQIYSASHATGISAGWIAAVIETESGGQPSVVSTDGYASIGLMQLIPTTAASVMHVSVAYAMQRLYDPGWNILAGATYLRMNEQYGGSLAFAVAAYNGGPGNPQWGYEALVASRVCG